MRRASFILTALLTFIITFGTNAQTLIQTVDGRCFWVEESVLGKTDITVSVDKRIQHLSLNDIAVLVDMERGIDVLQPDKLTIVEPKAFNGDLSEFTSAGKRVYVPVASDTVVQRWGARRLTELILKDKYWILVTTPEQADFILKYQFDEKGVDKAHLEVYDRGGRLIDKSSKVSAKDWVPVHAGEESAEKLYKKYVYDGIYNKDGSLPTATGDALGGVLSGIVISVIAIGLIGLIYNYYK